MSPVNPIPSPKNIISILRKVSGPAGSHGLQVPTTITPSVASASRDAGERASDPSRRYDGRTPEGNPMPLDPSESPPSMPSAAACKQCGYLLRGLPEAVCPECSRVFDPNDPTTYIASPRVYARRKLVRRAIRVAIVLLMLSLIAPRGVRSGNLKMTCSICGKQSVFDRWQLKSPSWVPFPYPGRTTSTEATGSGDCREHLFGVGVSLGGPASVAGVPDPGSVSIINGEVVSPKNAADLLRSIMAEETPWLWFTTVKRGTPNTPQAIEARRKEHDRDMKVLAERWAAQGAASATSKTPDSSRRKPPPHP